MTTPSLSADTPRGRMYRLEPGGPLVHPSITTVAGIRAKDHLMGWHSTMAAKRALEMYAWLDRNPGRAQAEIARVTRDRWGTQKRIAAAAGDHTRQASDFGTLVHAACEDWARSGQRPSRADIAERIEQMRAGSGAFAAERSLDGLLDRVAGRLDGYDGFLQDFSPEFLEVEQTVMNHDVGYAGTTDCIVRIGSTVLSGDIKTSKKVRGDYALQGVAVINAEVLVDDDGTVRDLPEMTGAFVIHLPEAGGYRVIPLRTTAEEFEVFRALRRVWGFDADACALEETADPKALLLSVLRAKGGLDALG